MDRGEEHDGEGWFWNRVDETPECWIWAGDFTHAGYGHVNHKGKTRMAHRMAYELEYGMPIPKDKWVLHKCDNPACVRPDHLYLGTPKDNARDAVERGRLHGGQTRRQIREAIERGRKAREAA
jgi:hypothetical protein